MFFESNFEMAVLKENDYEKYESYQDLNHRNRS